MHLNGQISFLLIATMLFLSSPATAEDQPLPANLLVALLFKSLGFDKSIAARGADGFIVGIACKAGDAAELTKAREIAALVPEAVGKLVKDAGTKVEIVELKDAQDVAPLNQKFDVVYLATGKVEIAKAVIAFSRANGVLVLTGDPEYVRLGAALGAVLRDQRPKLFVNLEGARAQGSDFDFRLVKLAEVVK